MVGKTPVFISAAFIVAGIALAAIGAGGVLSGSIGGGVLAGLGAIPACFGMWTGIQQETQSTLALSVSCVLAAGAVATALIVLRVVHWFL